uniref:NADH-ubiquinone oxidoreductase chain 4 n=1 Tax=Ochthebius lejolisii TaxID=1309210 RepID=A0A7H0DL17_9COLE|nr:NADH dehydrogenase subunit 4 [Ochthebius lejolisii]QNP10027.1 NADH dehydrogenase subunit 4 [Ochthebius lejolisii]WPM98415.1 NADH dehydrogenase subunit 4 [Ochthebius lejolisii]
MMKFLFMMMFMIPLSFKKKMFWLNQYLIFLIFFLFLFMFSFNYMYLNISYSFGCDLLSYIMIMLTLWICSLMIMASEKLYMKNYYYNFFLFLILMLMISLYCTFGTINLLMFYLFFEMSLIPTLILIIGWGYQPERIQAGIYLLFYTMMASLPMLISIFYYYMNYFTLNFYFFENIDYFIIYLMMNLVFFVKMPMYFVHLWLPKAHVEAPVSGSMILAGIMLKLGGYGLMRVMKMFVKLSMSINYIIIIISLVGGVFVSLMCLRQTDIKSLIAYSSISHMGLVLSGIMTLNYWGMCGAFLMMIAHGLCSSGLFCLANMNYERLNSRSMFLNKGLINLMPGMTFWWFMFSVCNMSAPPSLNLLGEIMLINSLISWSVLTSIMMCLLLFFSAAYSLYLYSYTQHGKFYSGLYSMYGGNIREYLLLFLHWFPLNLLLLKSEYFVNWV